MDRKSIIILVVAFLLLILWNPLVVNKLYPPKPLPAGATNPPAANFPTSAPSAPYPPPVTPEAPATALTVPANTNVPEELLTLTNSEARYVFSTYGGGIKRIELLRYKETVATRFEKETDTNRVATLNSFAPAPTLALLDGPAVEGDGIFTLTPIANGVRASKALTNGLTIVKDFQVSSNYLVEATIRLENHSSQSLHLPPQQWIVGTATPLNPRDTGLAVGVLWYNGAKTEDVGGASYFATRGFGCMPRVPPLEYHGGVSNVAWAAVHNQYFTLAAMPQQPAEALIVRRLDLPRPTGEEARLVATSAPPAQGFEAALVYPALEIAPNQGVTNRVFLYTGPKEYQTLARLADRFNNNIDLIMSFGTFGFVSKALLLGMNWLHEALSLPYGWAIVAITLIIKIVFWPLTQASTRSMKRMQALQPQLNAIKEKYKDDPMKANKKTMEFMREQKVSPLGGCLPMLLQVPVFFGFYRMIQSAIELRGQSFLWVTDLSKPDTLLVIPGLGSIPFIGIPGVGLPFNLLPLVMGATMLWQARLTPPTPGVDPTQQKIMRYMPLLFMLFLYNFSAGLTLYWTVQNLLTIAQTKLTRAVPSSPAGPGPVKGPLLTPPQKKRK